MKLINKIFRYELSNVLRSKWIIFYTLFFLVVSYSLFAFTGNNSKAILSLMNIVIIIIPLVSIIFGTMYLYNSREFVEMMLCQPIDRKSLFFGIYSGTAVPLSLSFVTGVIIPFLLRGDVQNQFGLLMLLLITGVLLTFIFTSVSFLVSLKNNDKVKGLGFSILIWLLMSIIYDSIILLVIYIFQDYPVENSVIALSLINPVDLGRIFFLLRFDISALMGYTGAVFQKFFGNTAGIIVSFISLILWIILPQFFAFRNFKRKDF